MSYKKNEPNYEQVVEEGLHHFSEEDLKKTLANEDIARRKSGKIGDLANTMFLALQMLKDVAAGTYKIPLNAALSIGFAIAYLISPIDAIPDFIPVLGFVDDIGVLGVVFAQFKGVIDGYRQWKEQQ